MCLIHSFMCSYITICHHPSEPCLRSYFCKNLHISMELSYGFQFWKINAKKNCVHISWYMLLFLSRVCSSSGANILPIPTQAKTWERHQRKWFHDQNIITFTCHQQLLLQTYSKMMYIAMVIAVYPATLYGIGHWFLNISTKIHLQSSTPIYLCIKLENICIYIRKMVWILWNNTAW